MGSQLGADQKYYISRCEEKQSIQLTITVVGDDEEHIKERRNLINDVTKSLDDIMDVFMTATKERPSLLIPCEFCQLLHIPFEDVCNGKTIFCPNTGDKSLRFGYYTDLLQGRLTDAYATVGKSNENYYFLTVCIMNIIITGVQKKKSVFTSYYEKLTHLNFKALYPALISASILSQVDNSPVLQATEIKAAIYVLNKISASLHADVDDEFDRFLLVLENSDNIANTKLAEKIRRDLLSSTTSMPSL